MLVILADDLTGAADSAARAHAAGLPAVIALGGPAAPQGVTALTSDSRGLAPDAAAEAVRARVASVGSPAAGARWYKKIDSTLRGNIAAELRAMLDATRLPLAVVCPAFPAQGRGLLGGRLVAPGLMQPGPDLIALLAEGELRAAHLPLEMVRGGVPALAESIARAASSGAQAIVADALADDDLAAVEAAAALAAPTALRCGSAGMAGVVARTIATERTERYGNQRSVASVTSVAGPTLLVIGSGSPAARRQIAHMRALPGVRAWELGELPPLSPRGKEDWGVRGTSTALLLHTPDPPPGAPLDGPEARALAEQLADEAAEIVRAADPALLVLSGGDTAMALLHRLGVARLAVLRELLPGMALAEARGADGRARQFILKPGAFGADDALAALLRLAQGDDR